MKLKKGWILVVLLLLGTLLSSCQESNTDISAEYIWNKVLWFGSLGFLGQQDNEMAAFMRILIFILVFAILFGISDLALQGFNRNIRIVITIILSLMSAIFIPGPVLAGIGASYATIVAFALLAVPIGGALYVFHLVPAGNRWNHFIRIILLLLILFILISVKVHATQLLNTPAIIFT